MTLLRISTPEKEGEYQGSKWLKFQVLCEQDELARLFLRLRPFYIFPLSGIVKGDPISEEGFLAEYGSWIAGLKEGRPPSDLALKKILAAALTDELDSLWLQEVKGKGYLMKMAKPVLLAQAHSFSYSKMDGVFRPMSMGHQSVFWGIQFSFPSLCQDAKTMELREVERGKLFEEVRLWVREESRATPFIVGGERINAPIRLGKGCFSWIGRHPQLKSQGISIHGC
jgi:hypothetical protein